MQRDKGWNRVDKAERQEIGRRTQVKRDKKNRGEDFWRGGTLQRDKGRRFRKDLQSVRIEDTVRDAEDK